MINMGMLTLVALRTVEITKKTLDMFSNRRLPYLSLRGGKTKGPTPYPIIWEEIRNDDREGLDVWNSTRTWGTTGAKMEEVMELMQVSILVA